MSLSRPTSRPHARPRAPAGVTLRDPYDVFVSYRRADGAWVARVVSELARARLRVFEDVLGDMAGRPWQTEVFCAACGCTVFCPVLSLASLRGMARGAAAAGAVDAVVLEMILALALFGAGRVWTILPLLLLVPPKPPPRGGASAAAALGQPPQAALEEEYEQVLSELASSAAAALPARASLALADELLRRGLGRSLPEELEGATVRDVLLGREASGERPAAVSCQSAPLLRSSVAFMAARPFPPAHCDEPAGKVNPSRPSHPENTAAPPRGRCAASSVFDPVSS